MMDAQTLSVIGDIAGGLLPALAWLWFWLREDSTHPEPRRLIALAFIVGMITVFIVVPIEQYVKTLAPNETITFDLWAIIEEICKFTMAALIVLWRKENDEPIDSVMYMVTVALGFAAAENALFLASPLAGTTLTQIFVTGDLRFVGATLLHVISSAAIGIMMAIAFYQPRALRIASTAAGVVLASLLHACFNFFILNTPQEYLLRTFLFVWIGVIALLAILEVIKRIHPRRIAQQM